MEAKHDPLRPRLRERIGSLGSQSLEDAELLALVLGTGSSKMGVCRLSQQIIMESGGLSPLSEMELNELIRLPGLGKAQGARLLAAFELGKRLWRPRMHPGQPLRHARDAAAHLAGCIGEGKREEFHALMLDTRHRLLGHRLISVGSLQSSIVHPREVFRPAIRLAAAALVVGHNHPSGDPHPSEEDEAVTERLREVGRVLGIPLLDHLVLGAREFHSFAEGRRFDLVLCGVDPLRT